MNTPKNWNLKGPKPSIFNSKIAQHQNLSQLQVQVYFDFTEMVPEQYDWLSKDLAAVNRQLALKYNEGGMLAGNFPKLEIPLMEMLWYQDRNHEI